MIKISSFAVHVTYTCPLTCAHCCFSSSPANKDRLPVPYILQTIKALKPLNLEMIAFTGGEPFLLGADLALCVAEAASLGMRVRVVTSAHWATTESSTEKQLKRLVDAGLTELSISWDDFHEEFVDFSNIKRAFNIARGLGVTTAISIVQSASSRWTANRVRAEIGASLSESDVVVESPLNQTGRAEEELARSGMRPQRHVGPCPYVLTGPTLNARGKLLACCGVIPETSRLIIDHEPTPESILNSIDIARSSALLNWLNLRGPYAIIQSIGEDFGEIVPEKKSIGGNCEACRILFETPSISRHIDKAVENKKTHISAELELLNSLGLLTSDGIIGLWKDGRAWLDADVSHPRNPPSLGEGNHAGD